MRKKYRSKLSTLLLVMACILVFIVVSFAIIMLSQPKKLTLSKIVVLSMLKGNNLAWSDFESYEGEFCEGCSLSIVYYYIDEDFDLTIGTAEELTEPPMYIFLTYRGIKVDGYIDLMESNIWEILYFIMRYN